MANKAVFGIVRTQTEAEALVVELQGAGFTRSDISVLFPDKGQSRDFAHKQGTKAPEGAIIGSGAGGVAGGVIGLLAGIGAIALPGLGALIAAGPVMAVLGGAAVGAAAGSAVGALVGLGMPEIQAKIYEGKLRDGNVLVAVHTDDAKQVDVAKKIYQSHNAEDVSVTSEASVPGAKNDKNAASTRA
jgi:hypothetical protein